MRKGILIVLATAGAAVGCGSGDDVARLAGDDALRIFGQRGCATAEIASTSAAEAGVEGYLEYDESNEMVRWVQEGADPSAWVDVSTHSLAERMLGASPMIAQGVSLACE